MSGITQSTALWYASRATGVVSLLLLTGVTLLGVLVNRQGRLPGLPRFAVTGLHRNLSLLAVAFVAVHVVTAVLDPYVTIGLVATVIPFTSPYKPLWLGLGAISVDLVLALILTSLARARLNRRLWRGLHWLAYLAWGSAVLHSLTSSTDLHSGALLYLVIGCAVRGGRGGHLAHLPGWPGAATRGARRRHAGHDVAAQRACTPARRGPRESIR